MDHTKEYFMIEGGKNLDANIWVHDWASFMPALETSTPPEMPIWQHPIPPLNQRDIPTSYYMNESPILSAYHQPSPATSSSVPSPNIGNFPRYTQPPPTPTHHSPPIDISRAQKRVRRSGSTSNENDEFPDEDSDTGSWDPSLTSSKTTKKSLNHRRMLSINKMSIRDAKRAHTVVEKNYRERLNDKIADLAVYLFETNEDSRAKPSKSLVMTRAKERLKQLESRNKSLESEVTKLQQQIAILDHIVASKTPSPGRKRGRDDEGEVL